ncbi:hypothetical protein H4219_004994 [Mycoemilia scoparia]|uniref:Ribosomal protein S8 n=1 Tax=Mycoemilia scoparia TaxID=417184 RepID=A0A9W7ZWC9_9FUNG|nr:hypothetical protein H4219_004994 [Mycoemilia scoparia]
MVGVFDLCTRVQNGFRARLAKIAVPETKLNLAVSRVLYQQGFISAVSRGTFRGIDPEYTETTNFNVAERRLWLTLKYYRDAPVLKQMSCISKPSRKVNCTAKELRHLLIGRPAGVVKPIIPGEIIVVSTIKGIMEINEAVQQNIGGAMLARAR